MGWVCVRGDDFRIDIEPFNPKQGGVHGIHGSTPVYATEIEAVVAALETHRQEREAIFKDGKRLRAHLRRITPAGRAALAQQGGGA